MTQVVFISKTYGSTCFRLFSSSLLCFRFSWAAKTIYLFVCLFILPIDNFEKYDILNVEKIFGSGCHSVGRSLSQERLSTLWEHF